MFPGFHRSCQLAFHTRAKLKGSEEPLVESADRRWVSVVFMFAQLMGGKCRLILLPDPGGPRFLCWSSSVRCREASGWPGLSDRGLKECPAMPWREVWLPGRRLSLSGERWVSPDSGGVTLETVGFFASPWRDAPLLFKEACDHPCHTELLRGGGPGLSGLSGDIAGFVLAVQERQLTGHLPLC